MTDRLQNLRSFELSRASIVIVPAILAIASLGGVTAKPLARMARSREAFSDATALIERARNERSTYERLCNQFDVEHCCSLTRRLNELVPQELTPIRIYNVLRLAASAGGIELGSIEMGEEYDQGVIAGSDTVVMREVRISGATTPAMLVAFVDEVRRCGLPTVVLDFSISRSEPGAKRFDFIVGLGLLYYSPAEEWVEAEDQE